MDSSLSVSIEGRRLGEDGESRSSEWGEQNVTVIYVCDVAASYLASKIS